MIYAIVTVLVLIADQAVKYWTTKNIVLGAMGADCKPLIDGVIHMTNVHNAGAAFGILQNHRWPLAIVAALFVILIIVLINKEIIHTPFGRWMAVLVMAGALGNCIDRVLYGYVVDMFEIELFSFGIFNVADIFITVCGILFCLHLIFYNEPEAVKQANEPEFMRRRREERAAKEAPYAAIPKRGEHTTPAEDIAADPDDPFAAFGFGTAVETPAEKATVSEPAAENAPGMPAKAVPAEAPETKPEPAAAPERDLGYEIEEFSLEDILSEFGDL